MNKNSFKKIVGYVLFILFALLIVSGITWVFRGNDSEARENVVGFDNAGSVDVVVFGGSDALRYYQPLEAFLKKGYTSYNYATSSGMIDMYRFYAEESRLTNDAQLYVFNIRSLPMLTEEIIPQRIRNWSDSLPVLSMIRALGIASYLSARDTGDEDIPSYFLDFIKYHENYDALSDPSQWTYLNSGSIDNVDKGFEPTHKYTPFERPAATNERGVLTEQQLDALNSLLNYCDNNELNALFICTPYIITEEDFKIINTAGDLIEKRGYPFINFNNYYDEIGLNFEMDFADVNHVNYLGSIKYTNYFIDYLNKNYQLPDHRDDKDFIKWWEDLNIFSIKQAEWEEEAQTAVEDHLCAKKIGSSLSDVVSFEEWANLIENENFNIIINKNKSNKELESNVSFSAFADKYNIDNSSENYIGIFEGANPLTFSNEPAETTYNIGVDNGRGFDELIIASGDEPKLIINNVDYYMPDSTIQILVYDKNYKTLVDNVSLLTDDSGDIKINR